MKFYNNCNIAQVAGEVFQKIQLSMLQLLSTANTCCLLNLTKKLYCPQVEENVTVRSTLIDPADSDLFPRTKQDKQRLISFNLRKGSPVGLLELWILHPASEDSNSGPLSHFFY